jgi:hypothetical protein
MFLDRGASIEAAATVSRKNPTKSKRYIYNFCLKGNKIAQSTGFTCDPNRVMILFTPVRTEADCIGSA